MTLGNDSDLSTCFAWAKSHRCTFMSTIKVSNVSMSVPPIAFRLFNLIYHQNSHTLITVIQFRMTDWANDASQGIEINRSANDLIQVKAENWFTKVGFHKTLTVSVNYPQLMSQSIPYYILKIFEFTHSGYVSQDTRLKSCISRSWLVDWSFCVEVKNVCLCMCDELVNCPGWHFDQHKLPANP